MRFVLSVILVGLLSSGIAYAQPNERKVGAWYMCFWNTTIKESPWGFQGDIQLRNWNILGDLEQLLLRAGGTFSPNNTNAKFTLGYAHITTGQYGDSRNTTQESRIYQEALLPHQIGSRFYLNHRFRYEQRFVESQNLRTRYRYNLFVTIPFNKMKIEKGALYLSLYNELFINGQRSTGNGTVELFDRNRSYAALGYAFKDGLKVQCGYMHQLTDNWGKDQLQLSLHAKF